MSNWDFVEVAPKAPRPQSIFADIDQILSIPTKEKTPNWNSSTRCIRFALAGIIVALIVIGAGVGIPLGITAARKSPNTQESNAVGNIVTASNSPASSTTTTSTTSDTTSITSTTTVTSIVSTTTTSTNTLTTSSSTTSSILSSTTSTTTITSSSTRSTTSSASTTTTSTTSTSSVSETTTTTSTSTTSRSTTTTHTTTTTTTTINPPNLLTNPGADSSLTGWTQAGVSLAIQDTGGSINSGYNPRSGSGCFAGGFGAGGAPSRLTQRVTLLGGAQNFVSSQLDSGTLLVELRFYHQAWYNFFSAMDAVEVQLTYLDAANSAISVYSTGQLQCNVNPGWCLFSISRNLPAGTRSIDYTMVFHRNGGTDIDSYIDDNSLRII